MTEQEFIERLKEIPFATEEYVRLGVSERFITRTVEGHNPKKKYSFPNVYSDDPLVRLVSYYDLTKTEIGMVSFGSEVKQSEDYCCVGKFEVDYLCVSKVSKEVVVIPFDDPLSVSYTCAQNGDRFLDAIILAAKYLERRMVEKSDSNQVDCSMAENCSELAGGTRYLDFYKVLLGCES